MLKQRFVVQFGSNIIINIVGMISGIFVARIGGPQVVGVIAFGTAYVSVWGFITSIFGASHIKLVSEGRNLGNCVTTYTWLQGGSMVLYFLAVSGWFLTQKFILKHHFENTEQQIIIILALFYYLLGGIIQFNNVTFTAKMRQVKSNYPFLIKDLLYHLGRIPIVSFGFKAVGLYTWNLISAIIVLPLALRQFKELPWGIFDKELLKKYLSMALPLFFIVVINSLLNQSDKLMLSYYSNVQELGYYSAAFSIGGMIMILSTVIGTIFFPLFSSLIAKNDWDTINQKIISFQEVIILFVLPFVCLMAIISGPFLTTLLGIRYEKSVIPFMILLFATFISIIGMPYGNIITGMGRFYLGVWINLVKLLIFFISITLLLSPRFLHLGATGMAINTLIMNLLNNILFIFFAKKYGNIRFSSLNGLRYILILLISGIIFYFVQYIKEFGHLWWIMMVPCYLVIVFGFLSLTGLLKKRHWKQIAEIINLKKTFQYIGQELREKSVDDK